MTPTTIAPFIMGSLTYVAISSLQLTIRECRGFTRLSVCLCIAYTWFRFMQMLAEWQTGPRIPDFS